VLQQDEIAQQGFAHTLTLPMPVDGQPRQQHSLRRNAHFKQPTETLQVRGVLSYVLISGAQDREEVPFDY
jgi:hypothetical protein